VAIIAPGRHQHSPGIGGPLGGLPPAPPPGGAVPLPPMPGPVPGIPPVGGPAGVGAMGGARPNPAAALGALNQMATVGL
jgi:formin 2